jgi:hypothetical protein
MRATLAGMRLDLSPVLGLLVLTLAMSGGCDRRTEPFIPAEEEPPAPERAVRIPGLEKPKPRPSRARVRSRTTPRSGAPVTGIVSLSHGAVVGPGAVLFVIARSPDGGPPMAAASLSTRRFPVSFSLGPSELMTADQPFAGPMRISARVDGDGDPLTRGPADLVGEIAGLVEPGQGDLEIVLHPVEQSPDS